MIPASIPSPASGNVHLGPLTIHMYGVMLLLGILAATALTGYRWTRRGGEWDLVYRAAVWGVAAGIVGARLYHVFTSPQAYFGEHGDLVRVLYVWNVGWNVAYCA